MPYDNLPSNWANAHRISDEIYVACDPDQPVDSGAAILVWHWCTSGQRWMAASPADHTVVSREPLHLEPSLLWPCCGKHGFIRHGGWVDA